MAVSAAFACKAGEYRHEKKNKVVSDIYPDGMHGGELLWARLGYFYYDNGGHL